MYAIIDIEGTGGNPIEDRIAEIAIIVHNGESIIEQFSSLVNPGVNMQPFVSSLTGITNAMLSDAPKFEELVPIIDQMTEGKVIVGHNVRYDYAMLIREYQRLQKRYIRKQLDTIRLCKKLLPELSSYSLSKICKVLGIPLVAHHRANADAIATAQLFSILLKIDSRSVIKHIVENEIKESTLPENINKDIVNNLPNATGVYYFKDNKGRNLYIGKAIDIRDRVVSHFSEDLTSNRWAKIKNETHEITYKLTGNEFFAQVLELSEIKRFMPTYNKTGKTRKHKFGVYITYDEDGFLRLEVTTIKEGNSHLTTTVSRLRAIFWIDKLLTTSGHYEPIPLVNELYQHPIFHKVLSIDKEEHNKIMLKIVSPYIYSTESFAVKSIGRTPNEKGIMIVKNSKIEGIKYYFDSLGMLDFNNLTYDDYLIDHTDIHNLVKSFLHKSLSKSKDYELLTEFF